MRGAAGKPQTDKEAAKNEGEGGGAWRVIHGLAATVNRGMNRKPIVFWEVFFASGFAIAEVADAANAREFVTCPAAWRRLT